MGAYYDFACPRCGYSAEVSGGPDVGMRMETRTMACGACRELVDVLVSTRDESDRGRLNRCPRCSSDRLEAWDDEARPCPKCGSRLKKGDLVGFWD